MSFFKRLFRVAKGQANAAMDNVEDATFEKTLKQNIRDMDSQLSKVVRSSAEAMSNHNRLENEYQKWVDQSADWKTKAVKALEAGREDLAKKALAKKGEADEQVQALQSSVQQAQAARETLKSQVDKLRQKIEGAKRNSSTLIARKNAANAQKQIGAVMAGVNVDDNAFSSLQRFEESVAKDEAMAKAYEDMSTGGDADLDAEFASLGDVSTDDELAKLKAELGK
ncbi:MAG: phage shock protein A [Planctomycetota bacterium]|jgi:phage shock protein A